MMTAPLKKLDGITRRLQPIVRPGDVAVKGGVALAAVDLALPTSTRQPRGEPVKSAHVRGLRFGIALLGLAAAGVLLLPYRPQASYEAVAIYQRVNPPAPTPEPAAVAAALQTQPSRQNSLVIPSIGVDEPIVEGKSLDMLLRQRGTWHQQGTFGAGNSVLAGHRFQYLPPNTDTFYNLGKLKKGAPLFVFMEGTVYTYEVTSSRTVDERDLSVLGPSEQPILTLYTCADLLETKRLVVVAPLVDVSRP